ncbi:PTPRZ1.2 family protein [Megaselia abdita]
MSSSCFLAVPSKPLNVTVQNVTSTTIQLSWHEPKNQNGAIVGYHVFHIHDNNQTGVEIVKRFRSSDGNGPYTTFILPGLKPFTDYKIIIKAFTTKFEGEPSDPVFQRTDISGPSQPIIMNLTCHSEDSIVLKWKRPYEYYQSIDSYVVNYRIAGRERFREIEMNASADVLEQAITLTNLTRDTMYEIRVGANSFSSLYPRRVIRGKTTELKKIVLEPDCDKIRTLERQSHNNYNFAVLVGIICSCFGIILIIMAFILWR